MKHSILFIVAVVLIVVIAASGYIGYNAVNQPSASPTPTVAPADLTWQEARETVIQFIFSNHTETQALPSSIAWTGGRVDTGLLGSDLYTYIGNGWNVTISNYVIPDPTYRVNAIYTANNIVMLDWSGTYFHGDVNETSYCYNP